MKSPVTYKLWGGCNDSGMEFQDSIHFPSDSNDAQVYVQSVSGEGVYSGGSAGLAVATIVFSAPLIKH